GSAAKIAAANRSSAVVEMEEPAAPGPRGADVIAVGSSRDRPIAPQCRARIAQRRRWLALVRSSPAGVAAVDDEIAAGHEVGGLRCEKDGDALQVGDLGHALHGRE